MIMNDKTTIGCVIMAAGNAKRFGENKLLAQVEGKTLMERVLSAIPAGVFRRVCVVTQYAEVEKLAQNYGFECIYNDRPEDGVSRTVRLGTEALQDKCDAIMYLVSDQPFIKRESIAGLAGFFLEHPDRIASASSGGRRGNPCVFPAKYFEELCSLTGDTGGGAVIRSHPEDLLLFEMSEEELNDIDTKEALNNLKR